MGNMLQRCKGWDYRERSIYMVTLIAENRLPVFGQLLGGEADARIELTAIGQLALDCWQELPLRYSGLELLEWQVMPEHFHSIVFVKKRQVRPLGAMDWQL